MDIPTDRELMQLQREAEQRNLLRGGRSFLVFIRAALFVFLAVGSVFLVLTCWRVVDNGGGGGTASPWAIPLPIIWNLAVLAMMRLVSAQLAGIKREQEAEQNLGGDSGNRGGRLPLSGSPIVPETE